MEKNIRNMALGFGAAVSLLVPACSDSDTPKGNDACVSQVEPSTTITTSNGFDITPEEDIRRQVIRLETLSKNLIKLSTEGLDEGDVDSHIRRILAFIKWKGSLKGKVSAEQQDMLDAAYVNIVKHDPYFNKALDALNSGELHR